MTTETFSTQAAQTSGTLDLPGSLGEAVIKMGGRGRLHNLYDEIGGRVYDDSTHVDPSEVRAMRRVLRKYPGPVLELAAGSGRLTLPLLTMGREVTALELTGTMINLLHENVRAIPESAQRLMTVVQADMSEFELGTSFGLVVLGAASISHLDADGRARLFQSVRRHLLPGGAMLFSIVIPMGEQPGDTDVAMDVPGRSGRLYRVHEHRSEGAEERLVGIYPILLDGAQDELVPVCVGTHRVLRLETILAQVQEAGLVVREKNVYEYVAQGLSEIFLEVGEPE